MKLKLKNTPEQVELIKAMGSKNPEISRPATEAFAAFIGPVVQQVLDQANTAAYVYTDVEYDEDDNPSYPLDLFYDQRGTDNYVTIWAQNMAGGLPSSQIAGNAELKVATYKLDSAVSFLKKYARKSRLDVVSKSVERMANEVLVKQDRNAWAVLLKGLAEGKGATGSGSAGDHVVDKTGSSNSKFTLDSPEIVGDIRALAYNPFSTSAEQVGDIVKDEMYKAAGANSIFGVNIIDLIELGNGQKYNTLFGTFYGGTFTGNDQVVVGVDRSREALVRPVARNSETGGTFTALPDDQFATRQDKTGFYGGVEEGRVLLDARVLVGLVFERP